MKTTFVSEDPRYPLRVLLDELLADALEVRVAVAYCTARGAHEIDKLCEKLCTAKAKADPVKVTVSIRAPTALRRLAVAAAKWPGVIRIHIGKRLPAEGKDKGHFHSKVVAVKRKDGTATILVGSHNWTGLEWTEPATMSGLAGHDVWSNRARCLV